VRGFYGWRVVAAAFVVLFTAYGAQYSFGVFFNALLQEFHWSRASLSGVFSLYAFGYSVLGFPAGRLTDAWGPSRVIIGGGLVLGGALAAMALVRELWQPYLFYGVIAALGMATAYVPCNSTVVKWFVRRRGLAVGLASSGGSVGTFVVPPLAQLAVSGLGWRGAYLVLGVTVFAVLAAAAPLLRLDPESMGLHPDGDPAPPAARGAGAGGLTLGAAARTGTFWLMAVAFAATWIPVFIPLVHLVPLARDLGHSPLTAAAAMSVLGAGAVLGRLVMGAVSDRIGRRPTIGLGMVLQAVGFAAFTVAHELPSLYAAALLFGFSYGTVSTLFPAIVGDVFGRAHAGAIVGCLFALAGCTAAWGPLLAGAAHDATGSYRMAFWISAGLNVVAVALLAACRSPGRVVARAAA
jgi:OFA family oxalate/formate antiporter-like MFS transporter